MTLGAVQAINESSLRIPKDISLVGFDYFELSDIIYPKLTVVVQPIQEIGKNISKLILDKMENKSNECRTVVLKTELLIRDSVKKIN